MAAREGVRSSARLSGATTTTANVVPTTAAQDPRAAEAERAAAAALRRARAVRAAERAREVEDSPQVLREKCRRLARVLREAKHLVYTASNCDICGSEEDVQHLLNKCVYFQSGRENLVRLLNLNSFSTEMFVEILAASKEAVYTGAGISTAADIPDYRGPRGVWTRLQRGETVGRVEVSRARPTFTHMALTALWARGALKFVVSQNCDGLHVRAGLPRRALAELHGDMFAERCPACRRVYLRAFDTTERTARHAHATRRLCHACGRELRDSIVHFGERGRSAWPLNWAGALRHAAAADVVLCLGSSLKVLRRYPRLWRMQSAPHARPALYIVNLQWTPKDGVAAMKINARCDAVMRQVARRLRLRVPRYRARRDPLLAHAEPLAPAEAHTTRRPLLTRPPPPLPPQLLPPAALDSDDTSYYSLSAASSPSASDSDDELPLGRLADRLRVPPPPPLPSSTLRSFQVNMQSGETTILLRAEHAPTDPPPPEPPPPSRTTTDALRRFRISRPHGPLTIVNGIAATTNGHRFPGHDLIGQQVKIECPSPAKIKKEESPDVVSGNGSWDLESKLKRLLELESRIDGDETKFVVAKEMTREVESDDEQANASLAAAIIRRAVLVCRAELYPGLHTIITPTPTPSPAILAPVKPEPKAITSEREAECAWCLRHYEARRCLWYGPPRDTPPERRKWRRERGRRYLCACCSEDGEVTERGPDDGGWYGKGYRKGRRKRR